MTPLDIQIIEKKKALIVQEVNLLRKLQKRKITSKSDPIFQHALSHSIQNVISATIDIAQHIAVEKLGVVPSSYSESIELLGQAKILSKKFANELSEAAKLRNVVVHAYDKLDISRLASYVPKLLRYMKKFMQALDKAFF